MRESYESLKKRVSISMILTHYGVDLSDWDGEEQLRLHCPICKYTKSPSLSVHRSKNLFRCFHNDCAQGNILDFVATMEKCNHPDAAKKLAGFFPVKKKEKKKVSKRESNKPLSFVLQNIDYEHASLHTLGIRCPDRYGVGRYTGRGQLKDSIVFPIYDPLERLLAYGTLQKKGGDHIEVGYPEPQHFCRDADLYCPVVTEGAVDTLIITRSPYDAMLLHEKYSADIVAFMGGQLSGAQVKLLAAYRGSYSAYHYVDSCGERQLKETHAALSDIYENLEVETA